MFKHWKNRVRLALPVAIGYALLLAAATHWPPKYGMPSIPHPFDKVCHITAYSGLTLLAAFVIGGFERLMLSRYLMLGIGIAATGALDELTQPYFGRSCDLDDWFADMLGCGLGIALHLATAAISASRRTAAHKNQ